MAIASLLLLLHVKYSMVYCYVYAILLFLDLCGWGLNDAVFDISLPASCLLLRMVSAVHIDIPFICIMHNTCCTCILPNFRISVTLPYSHKVCS